MKQQSVFLTKLLAMFAQVEPKFREQTREYYKLMVESQWDSWQETLKLPFDQLPLEYGRRHIPRSPDYITFEGALSHTWEAYQKANWKPLWDKAARDADAEVDNARAHFTIKLDKKLRDATKQRNDFPKLSGQLANGQRITGFVLADYPNGDSFRVELSIVRNVRYERGFRPYYQFPARFSVAKINGAVVRPKSLAWMQENFKANPCTTK